MVLLDGDILTKDSDLARFAYPREDVARFRGHRTLDLYNEEGVSREGTYKNS